MDSSHPTWPQSTIALTGTIGSGKSTVAKILQKLGAFIIDADALAHQAVEKDSSGLASVVAEFGPEILNEDASLNRKKLGELVFHDPSKRKKLEAIIHPMVRDLAAKQSELAQKKKPPLIVYDCPLLFEAGLDKAGFQEILLVCATPQQCFQRIMKRDRLSMAEAKARLASQLPLEYKKERASMVIDNSSSLDALEEKVQKVFDKLRK